MASHSTRSSESTATRHRALCRHTNVRRACREIRHAFKVSVNDVLMAALAGALRRCFEARGAGEGCCNGDDAREAGRWLVCAFYSSFAVVPRCC
jgi:hypothetical protein